MKRMIMTVMLACAAVALLCLTAPEGHAATHTHHCYCGGTEDHVCETDTQWTPVNSGNVISVTDGGHYYLEKNMAASITVKNGETVTLCLNGYTLRAQCPVVVYNGVLNICDCQGTGVIRTTVPQKAKGVTVLISSTESTVGIVNQYSGTLDGTANDNVFCRAVEIKGGVYNLYGGTVQNGVSDGSVSSDSRPGYGGSILVQNSGENIGKFCMYGGTVTGGKASVSGGNVFAEEDSAVSILGGTVENGTADYGGNLYYLGALEMENATLRGGTARVQRGNLFVARGVELLTNTVSGGTAAGMPENIRVLRNKTTLSTDHSSLAEAVEKMKNDQNPEQLHLQLLGDHNEEYTLADTVKLDLNGFVLSGIQVSGTVYGLDSATDSYSTSRGRLSYALRGGQVLGADSYLKATDAQGDSFHRYDMRITHINVVPSKVAMGYKASVYGDETVLSQIDRVGYQLWLEGDSPQAYSKSFDNTVVTLRLQQILSQESGTEENLESAQKKINARPFMVLRDGTRITFGTVGYSFRDALHKVDNNYAAYNDAQKQGLQSFAKTYSNVLTGWDVENLHHATKWQSLTQSRLSDWVTFYSNSSNANQKMVLAEDLDMGSSTFRINAGCSLTICLNGYDIKGTKQLFACYGNLTICDCHEDGYEGTLTSSFASTNNEYAPVAHLWTGTMTLYGGNLTAGGSVRSAGVMAVGNPYKEAEAANFYMYGGSISGGYARYNGGLMNIWHGSAFHMYGGKLYDGYCEDNGGGLVLRDGSTANLYGGEIYNCTALGNGGGVFASNNAVCYLGQVKLYNNTAHGNGGNFYNSNSTLTVDGATVTGGKAQMGGGILVYSGAATVTGTTKILDNTADTIGSDLHIYLNGSVCADGLTQGADVYISAGKHGKVGTDPAIADYLHCATEGYQVMKKGEDMVLWNGSLVESYTQEGFTAGYGSVCITPKELGVPLAGYGDTINRKSESVDGDLYVTATAMTDENGETVPMLTADLSTMSETQLEPILSHVSYYTGIPRSHIFSATSHTHSAPSIGASDPTITRYRQQLPDWFAQAAIQALNDRAPATMYTGSFDVTGKNGYGLNFTRHYKFLRDGVWEYSCDNFGERSLNKQEQVQHVTDADPTMHLVKFDRAGTDILMINWRAHPTMTGGTTSYVLSSDYVGALREAVKADTGMDVIFFQGAAGNINAVSRLTKEAHGLNFREYGQALSDQIQAAIADGCLTQKEIGLWQVDNYQYTAVVDHSDDDRYEEAKAFVEEYYETFPGNQAPQQERLDWCAERGWTCVFEASSIIRRYEKTNATENMPLNTMALGKHLAFYTAPGELWDTVSQEVENAGYFDTVFCVGYSMASYSYFVYDPTNGGAMQYESYEGFNRNFVAPTTINDMLAYWKETLETLAQNAE